MKRIFTIFITLIIVQNLFAQSNSLTHEMWYSSHDQNMWGPDSAYGIDVEASLFNVNIDESWGFTQITDFLGMQLGVGFNVGIQAILASTFEAYGFHTGRFDLDYPIAVHLDFPEDTTFNYGGPATIYTSFEVTDGWALTTDFPPTGVITLDFEYMFNPFMDIVVCIFGCDTIHIIPPSVQIPHTLDTLFHINGETEYCVYPCYVGDQFQFCHDYELPVDVDLTDLVGFNFEMHIDLPFVETEDYINLDNNCLIAQGDSMYLFVHLDVIGFLYVMAGYIPPPEGPQIQEAIAFLNDTISYPINTPLGDIVFQIEYSLLEVTLMMRNYLHQDIFFCPTIWGTFDFPVPLEYEISNPNDNSIVETGFSNEITVAIGNNLTITYPCHDWDTMPIGVKYNIQPTIRNHTWDSIAFSILIEALRVDISIITPFGFKYGNIEMPEFELPEIPVISETSNTSNTISSPTINLTDYYEETDENGETKLGPWTIGPLFSWEIALGYIPLTWFDQTWELMHFEEDLVFPGTRIVPRPKSEVNALLYSLPYCYNEPYNYILVQAQNGISPFTYTWSTGDIVGPTISDLDSIYAPPGYYAVTITDVQGCESYDSITITINPPLYYNIEVVDILCQGTNNGIVNTNVSGGTPPYFFEWYPSGSNAENPSNLTAGWHYVTITDWFGCQIIDSAYISEPASALSFNATVNNVQCHGMTNGSISLQPSGASPPYNYIWNNSATTSSINNIAAGAYIVTVVDNNNCNWVEVYVINEPDTLIATIHHTDVMCNGYKDGTIITTVSGGVQPYTYTWFHDPTNHEQNLTNLAPGLYMVSVVDAHHCSDTALKMIIEPDALALETNIFNVSCYGLYNGTIMVTPSGGVPGYVLAWSNSHYGDSIGNLFQGEYTVTLTDSHNCKLIETYTIGQPELLRFTFQNIKNVSCNGLSDASAQVVPYGGTAPYTIVWESGVNQIGDIGYDMPANQYFHVNVSDVNNCHYLDSIKFTQPDILKLSANSIPVECGETPGQGFANASGGTAPYTFYWSNGEITSNAINLPSGNISITVTDFNNCADSINIFVEQKGNIKSIGEVIKHNICFGYAEGIASATSSDGTAPLSFLWSNGETNDTVYNLPAGIYHVITTDAYNCADSIIIEINQPDSINPGLEFVAPSCSGIFDGEIVSKPSGGTQPYDFIWSTGSSKSKITDIRDGFYFLTITDSNQCISISEVELIEAEYCLIIFNTFTPNGDGVNDTWYIENIENFPYNKIWVYNRNGNLVYSSEYYTNDWDGTYKGEDLPAGTYYFIIDPGAGKDIIKGHVTIIR